MVIMTTFRYKPYKIADLWAEYLDKKSKGIDEPYINIGDYVVIQSEDYLKSALRKSSHSDRILAHSDYLMYVVQSCKVAEDLYYTTVVDSNGEDLILIDDDIKMVYKKV